MASTASSVSAIAARGSGFASSPQVPPSRPPGATASGQASEKRRRLDELTNALQPGDRLVVSELSRLGRSLGQVVAVLDALAKAGVAFVALKENIRVEGKRDIQTKVMTTLFALFAEVERDLIYERGCPAAFLIWSSSVSRQPSGTASASFLNIVGSAERYTCSS